MVKKFTKSSWSYIVSNYQIKEIDALLERFLLRVVNQNHTSCRGKTKTLM